MEIFSHKTNFDFLGKAKFAYIFSGMLILVGIVSLIVRGGPNLGIDFTGGTLLQVGFQNSVNIDDLRKLLGKSGFENAEMQSIAQEKSVIIRIKSDAGKVSEVGDKIFKLIKDNFAGNEITLQKVEFVGPAVGKFLLKQAYLAIFFSFIGMIIYVAFRFKAGVWGFAGVIAIMHDVFIVYGLFALMNKEISLTIIAALLTLAGYSINDTIVIFDRIRESIRLYRKDSIDVIMNRAINETLSRTIITSLCVLFPLITLFFLGGEVLHDFSFALIAGILIGTYSSVFVATPIVHRWIGKNKMVKI